MERQILMKSSNMYFAPAHVIYKPYPHYVGMNGVTEEVTCVDASLEELQRSIRVHGRVLAGNIE